MLWSASRLTAYALPKESPAFGPASLVREPNSVPAPKPRLLDRVREALRIRHYSRRTEEAYVAWIRRYILFHDKRHLAEMGGPEVTASRPRPLSTAISRVPLRSVLPATVKAALARHLAPVTPGR